MDNSGKMENAKKHVDEIRKDKFWIGVGKNPVSRDLRMAVKYLSAELYSKDVHFLMELIQNAEDNEYLEGVEPSLEFLITSRDVTGTGVPATLMIFNNEKGFSEKNIASICSVGDSTKAGCRKRGYIGEKGIGFKSVFLLTATPYIFSNGYQIRFNETPCAECDIAYIVPEWVDNKPCVSEIHEIYGNRKPLPTTTLILPLKCDKIKAVKEQLSSLHPELLLFLSKIKRLSVKEDNDDPKLNSVRAISISSERDVITKKNIDAESYTVQLAAEEGGNDTDGKCWYYMWRQRFPVKAESKVEKRKDIEEWSITLAFPYGKRLNRGMTSPGIYAFLPTEMVTNLPFIIQADFLLPSSRETILWDDVWNQGILDCVPSAFVNAFVSLVKSSEDAPASTLASMFAFLPVNSSPYPKLKSIRESIKEKLLQENIILSESHSKQRFFHKPNEVSRLMSGFWKVLLNAKSQGAKLHNLCSQGRHILHSSFDASKYNDELTFLGIEFVEYDWYSKCIQSCNLVGVGDYMELLSFLAKNWESQFDRATMRSIPLLKYVTASGDVSLLTVNEAREESYTLCRSEHAKDISWLIDWSKEFTMSSKLAFLPKKMQESCLEVDVVLTWMKKHVNVKTLNVYGYSNCLKNSLKRSSCKMVIAFAHFLHHSYTKDFLNTTEVRSICSQMPLVDRYGDVYVGRKGVLVPANGSKWVDLLGSNPWKDDEFMELSEDYLHSGQYAAQRTPENELMKFLRKWAGACDIPGICPPNSSFPAVSSPLGKENAFLLLDWIKTLRNKGIGLPGEFLSCIKAGNWLRVRINGSPNYKPPSQSFLPSSSWGELLQNGSDMVDIPLVDKQFYDNKLTNYHDELKAIGVMFECNEACNFIGRHLMCVAKNYNLTSTKVIAMLNFIRFLRTKYLPADEFINCIKNVNWVRTSCGDKSPGYSVLYDESWKAASTISNIPFIDQDYYTKHIVGYKVELKLLGVIVDLDDNNQTVIDHIKSAGNLNCLTAECLLLALKCICNSSCKADKLVASLKSAKCLKTNLGYLCPAECFLFDREWGCMLQVFDYFPCIDGNFYGNSILQYKVALRKIGVVVEFDAAVKKFCTVFKQRASSKSFTKENALSLIACYRNLKNARQTLPSDFITSIHEAKWLRTRLGDFRSPKECILFSSDWQSISQITLLPFVDDSVNGYGKGIQEWRDELKSMDVVIDLDERSPLVLSHIFFPHDPKDITPGSVISLLKCLSNFLKSGESFPEAFLKQVKQTKWLKSTLGYKSPQECLLFSQQRFLQLCDGPFIDEKYYGPLSSYKAELAALGVIIDLPSSDANSLLTSHLMSLTEFTMIERIYAFLNNANWMPANGASRLIWFPTSNDDGTWVSPNECVLHDASGLFKSRLHVLDGTKYMPELLLFFSKTFEVRSKPSVENYCTLWKEWENSRPTITVDDCQAFWGNVVMFFNSKNESLFFESVTKVPAFSDGSSDVVLLKKHDVFIPDDLLLKDLFDKSSPSPDPIFVWYPRKNKTSTSRLRLFHMYSKIGVKKISETIIKCELSDLKSAEWNPVNPKDIHVTKGLVVLILGFLADPELNIDAKSRHNTVKRLLDVTFFETSERISMSYSLKMTSGDTIEVSTNQMVRWQRESGKFISQKLDKSGGHKNVIEYATMFSEVVAQALLWEKADLIPRLTELIKFGFLMDFDEDAVTYFMKSKNLQIFAEDEEFLSTVFLSI